MVDNQIFYFQSQQPSLEEPGYETVLLQEKPHLKVAFLDKDGTLVEAQTQLFGQHNFQNIMTAICIGKYFKVPAGKIKYALEHYTSSNNRSQMLEWPHDCQVLLDAYNANPSSMMASLGYFVRQETSLKKLAILGDMLELGADSAVEHERVARYASQQLGPEGLILVGTHFADIAQQLSIQHFPNVQELQQWFDAQTWANTFFFVKGSRGIRLEQLFAIRQNA
jgi:UDP-N-acetylmuramoyl-tripeptide--D-alanyl-D-alanine ligase